MSKPILACPRCSSPHATKRGRNGILGKKRYQCKNCGKFYTDKDGTSIGRVPRILLFDIETLPMKVYCWDLYPHYVNPDNIIQDWTVLSWAAKWLFDTEIMSDVLTSNEAKSRNDKRIIGGIWKLLDEADIIIAHNAKNFDVKKLNTRYIYHKLSPPSPYLVIDTREVAKKKFGFSSNKLDYINKYLGLEIKTDTDFELWKRCDAGDSDALKEMHEYNRNDTGILEELYVLLRPWVPQHPNMNVYVSTDESVCPKCGTKDITVAGSYATPANSYRSFRCGNCGAIGRSSSTNLSKEKRKNMIKPVD